MKNCLVYSIVMFACTNAWKEHLGANYPKDSKKMPETFRQLSLLKEDCGEVCDTSDKWFKQPGKYFDMIKKEFECDFLFESDLEVPRIDAEQYDEAFKSPLRVFHIPPEILEMYTYEQRVPVASNHMDDAKWTAEKDEENIWSKEIIDLTMKAYKEGTLFGGYGPKIVKNMSTIIQDHMIDQVKDGHVLVIGSQSPWIEAMLLVLGAKKITTLEYSKIVSEHPQIDIVTPEELRKQYNAGKVPQFDAMVSFSSLEHSGLGRYGDALNPYGDLITMAKTWCLTRPGGRALVGLPCGMDLINFNANKLYGRIMLPHLFANWNQIYSEYRDHPNGLQSEAKAVCGEDDADGEIRYCFQPMTVLEKPLIMP